MFVSNTTSWWLLLQQSHSDLNHSVVLDRPCVDAFSINRIINVNMILTVCMCEGEGERERERGKERKEGEKGEREREEKRREG